LGTYCESYCRIVTTHHAVEDQSLFPQLRSSDARLSPVIDRLEEEHIVIHELLEGLDRALLALVAGFDGWDSTEAGAMTMDWYYEDFAPGQVFTSQGRTITESDIAAFAAWSWDTNPVHTDAEWTRESRFGERIAHGLLGMSVAMGLTSRLGVFEKCSIALLDVERWKFTRPLLVGDTVHCTVEILGTRVTGKGDAGILRRHFTLVNQREEEVQSGDIALMVRRRPTPIQPG
jgi:acyl dehydratase